jgi:nucleotide-binding universal stress UspA family protein
MRPGSSASEAGDIVYKALALARHLEPSVDVDPRIENGAPSTILTKASGDAELVVIGSRGLGLMVGALVGSTGLDLAANARCPVVVVRPDLGSSAGIRVVIGYDGSSASEKALDVGLDYARRHDLAVRVVAAQPAGTELHRITEAELRDAVHARGGHDAELVQITGHPAEHILRLAADANLIVLGARGRGGFAGMLIGSVKRSCTTPTARSPSSPPPPPEADPHDHPARRQHRLGRCLSRDPLGFRRTVRIGRRRPFRPGPDNSAVVPPVRR